MLYFYRPVQQNVHRRCEPESETVLVVTRGELLAIWIAGNLKGKILSSAVGIFMFLVCKFRKLESLNKDQYIIFLCTLYVIVVEIFGTE